MIASFGLAAESKGSFDYSARYYSFIVVNQLKVVKMKITYSKGQKINGLEFIEDLGGRPRKAKFKCKCGKIFKTRIDSVKGGQTKSCKCLMKVNASPPIKHNLSYSKEYCSWDGMKQRCFNKKHKEYFRYGGRGISIYPIWIKDFKKYYGYITNLIDYGKENYTIDRIDPDGNYEPGNIRWADKSTQSANQRIRNDNTSGYIGIFYIRNKYKYSSYIDFRRKRKYLGRFIDIKMAINARNEYIIENKLPHKIQNYG